MQLKSEAEEIKAEKAKIVKTTTNLEKKVEDLDQEMLDIKAETDKIEESLILLEVEKPGTILRFQNIAERLKLNS